jgi:inner membrane protein
MLGRTHQIVAIGSVVSAAIIFPQNNLTTETAVLSLMVAMIGGLAPDIDKPGSKIWDKIPAGGILSRIINPIFIGGHRHLTHSILGTVLFALGFKILLNIIPLSSTTSADTIYYSFLIGFVSHLFADMLTKDGVPLLFPLPFHFGLPPFEFMRIRTNGLIENLVVSPGIILCVVALARIYPENAKSLTSLLGL